MIGSVTDWVILIVVILVLFGGARKIPELARAMGRAMGEFRKGQAEVEREIQKMATDTTTDHSANVADNKSSTDTDTDAKIAELERQLEELKKSKQS
ncbi:MAG: twin-arginine translocase TatA/TatE family subunit [Conexivisphaerales archaeon]